MHRLHRVVFSVVREYETANGIEYSYGERRLLIQVTPAELEARRRDLEDELNPFGRRTIFPPRVLWHSHYRRRKGRLTHPRTPPRRRKERARRRRELMLRDKQGLAGD